MLEFHFAHSRSVGALGLNRSWALFCFVSFLCVELFLDMVSRRHVRSLMNQESSFWVFFFFRPGLFSALVIPSRVYLMIPIGVGEDGNPITTNP